MPETEPPFDPVPVTVIEPPRGWIGINVGELWRYRDLFALLVQRDLVARYRQSIIGIGWAVLRPLISMIIFTFIFSKVAGIPSDGSPYALFTFSALLPWLYFSGTLQTSTSSIVGSAHLLRKVYFPRLILPLVGAVTGLVELLIQFVVLIGLMFWYQFAPGWQIVLAPLFILMAAASAVSAGLWLTALNVKYRDIGQAVPFLVQAWMWLCPIVYSSSQVPEEVRPIYALNPMVGVIEGFRWCFLGTTTPDWNIMAISFAVVLIMLLSGLLYFRKVEDGFADII
ncbi:ABC transporter permease [Stieleria neptunia]|nr:ABC transporter permease [Stieleria neptunia]